MKLIFQLSILTIVFMIAGSLFAIPSIDDGLYTYSEIFWKLVLGDIASCLLWLFVYFDRY